MLETSKGGLDTRSQAMTVGSTGRREIRDLQVDTAGIRMANAGTGFLAPFYLTQIPEITSGVIAKWPNTSAIAPKNPPALEFQIPAAYSFPVW